MRFYTTLILIFSSLLISCSGESPEATTSTFALQVIGVDESEVSYTGTETSDPRMYANYYVDNINYTGMNIVFSKGWQDSDESNNQVVWLSFIPNGETGTATYSDTSSNVDGYLSVGSDIYRVFRSAYTPMTMTTSSYGEIGETIDATFDAVLCHVEAIDDGTCSDSSRRIQIVGSYSVIRGEDL